MMGDFQHGLVSRIFSAFSSGFLRKTTLNLFVEWLLTCFFRF